MKEWKSFLLNNPQRVLLIVLSIIIFMLLFSWHYKVGMTRYFDVDEFTYFHWVSQFAQGEKPYVDFFLFFPPLFLIIFAPVFLFFANQISVFLAGRFVAICIAFLLFISLSMLFGIVRKKREYILFPAIIAAFLPMPFDKFFEIRPDNLAVLFALIGVISHGLFLQEVKSKMTGMIAGFFYAASLLVFPKTISFVSVAGIIWLLDMYMSVKKMKTVKLSEFKTLPQLWFIVGGGVMSLMIGIYLLLLGNLSQVVYSLTTLALETNKTYAFIMEPHLFFFPNAAFYGGDGITLGLFFNHLFWILGIIIGAYRLFTSLTLSNGNVRIFFRELLLAGIFFVNIWLYISFYPMKHPQYLIPVGLFVAFYSADGLALISDYISRIHKLVPLILVGILCSFLLVASQQVNEPKLSGNNVLQLTQLKKLKESIPPSVEVFDIEGRMVFWKQPYVVCCLPFGEYMYQVSRPPPPLRDVLEEKKVQILWQGNSRRIYTLEMPDRIYIQNHYEMVEGWGDALWKRK